MDRPTCGTCPYLKTESFGEGGLCRIRPPAPTNVVVPENTPGLAGDDLQEAVWPYVLLKDWCGEHPEFPAYIASLKPASPHDEPQVPPTARAQSVARVSAALKQLPRSQSEFLNFYLGLEEDGPYSIKEIERMFPKQKSCIRGRINAGLASIGPNYYEDIHILIGCKPDMSQLAPASTTPDQPG